MAQDKAYWLDGINAVGIRYMILGREAIVEASPRERVDTTSLVSLPPLHLEAAKSAKSADVASRVLLFKGSAEAYHEMLSYVSGLREVKDEERSGSESSDSDNSGLKRSGSMVSTDDYRFFDTFDLELRKNQVETYIWKQRREVTGKDGKPIREPSLVTVVRSPLVGSYGGVQEKTWPLDPVADFSRQDPNQLSDLWTELDGVRRGVGKNELLMPVLDLYIETEIFRYLTDTELKAHIAVQAVTAKFPGQPYPYKWYELEVERIGKGENVDVRTIANHLVSSKGGLLLCAPEPKQVKAMKLMREEELDIRGTAAENGARYLEKILSDSSLNLG